MEVKKTLKFIYSKLTHKLEVKSEPISYYLDIFSNLIGLKTYEISFYHKGKPLDKNKQISQYKDKNIVIFAFKLNINIEKENINNITCPICKNLALITVNNDRISITNCCNKHNILNIPLDEFNESQNINDSKKECDLCKNRQNLYGDKFKFCSCGKRLCNICSMKHEAKHKKTDYKNRYTKCIKHGNFFETYCLTCNVNLCQACEI